jgi:hypothetical protein
MPAAAALAIVRHQRRRRRPGLDGVSKKRPLSGRVVRPARISSIPTETLLRLLGIRRWGASELRDHGRELVLGEMVDLMALYRQVVSRCDAGIHAIRSMLPLDLRWSPFVGLETHLDLTFE